MMRKFMNTAGAILKEVNSADVREPDWFVVYKEWLDRIGDGELVSVEVVDKQPHDDRYRIGDTFWVDTRFLYPL